MRTELTPEEIRSYHENGFVVIEDLLDPTETKHWRQTIGGAVERRSSPFLHLDIEASMRASGLEEEEIHARTKAIESVWLQRAQLWQTDEGARDLILDERLGKLAADLHGIDAVRLFHDMAVFKPPFGRPTAFHIDMPYWSFTSPHASTLWIALEDTTLQNGCMYFVPGSHKVGHLDFASLAGEDVGALFELVPEWKEIDPVPCPLRAGSATFHNGLTAHGAGANMTSRPRLGMTLQFMPEGATFNGTPNILPPDYVASLSVGDSMNDNDINPLLFARV